MFQLTTQGRRLGYQLNEGLSTGGISKLSDIGAILATMAPDAKPKSLEDIETEVFGFDMRVNRLSREKIVNILNKAISQGYVEVA